MKIIKYYHFGPQCYGYQYMGQQAKKAAELLNYSYKAIDISNEDIPEELKIYCPGNIVVDELIITYPGTPEQLIESIKLKGPLKGNHVYTVKESEESSNVKSLIKNLSCGSCICLKSSNIDISKKQKWLENEANYVGGEAGFIAFKGQEPVAAVEFVSESRIPYAIPKKRKDFLFITCIYNKPSTKHDYRNTLIDKVKDYALDNGFNGVSIIAGYETPYPNGPVNKLLENGFIINNDLGQVMLRYKWEKTCFMEWTM